MVLLLQHTVRSKIPHLRVGILDILLHSEERRLRLVLSILHIPELLQVRLDVLLRVLAPISRAVVLSSTLKLDFCVAAVANVGLSELNQLLRMVVQPLEVVA